MHGTFRDIASGESNVLKQRIAASEDMLSGLRDPCLGDVGLSFLCDVAASSVREREAGEDQICNNVYIPFVWDEGFVNEISYKSHRFSREAFFVSRCHELTHALAWDNAPVLHASVFNRQTPVILCPRDWVRVFEMTEADVAAKTAWLATLAARIDPSFHNATAFSPVTTGEYEAAFAGDTASAIATVANTSMRKFWGLDNRDGKPLDFGAFYHWLALRDYENMIGFYERNGIRPIVARMEPWHREDLGRSFGPNPFAGGRYDPLPIKDLEEQRIAALNARLGIMCEDNLPYLETALQWYGHSPQSLLFKSKSAPIVPQFSEVGMAAPAVA